MDMFEHIEDWIRKNIKCCACGGTLETSEFINVVKLEKVATWKFPVYGYVDILDYKPQAAAIICDECIRKKEKPRYCIEWEESPYHDSPCQVKYHDVGSLEDTDRSMNQINYYFGRKFRLEKLLRRSVRQKNTN